MTTLLFVVVKVMALHFTFYSVGLLLTAACAGGVAYFAWQRRQMIGGRAFFRTMLGTVWWALMLGLEAAALRTSDKITFAKLQYFGIVTVPIFWFIFVSRYIGRDKWLTRRNQLLLWVIPAMTLALVLTNEWHHLHWESIYPDSERLPEITRGRILIYENAPLAWIFVGYAYALLIGGTAALLNFALHTAQVYRQQTRLLTLATLIALSGDVLYMLEAIPIEVSPITITLAGLLTAWNIARFRLLEIVPIAREVLFEHLHDGVLIINPSGRIADLNPEAERMLGRHIFIGQPIETALKAHPDILSIYREESEREVEVGPLILEIRATRLVAPRHEVVGCLMTLRDVTLRRKTEDALQENIENLSLLRQIDNELNRSLALEVVLDIAVDAVIRGSRAADGFIAVFEENTLVSARGFGGYYGTQTLQWDKGIVARVLRTQQPEWVKDVSTDPDYVAHLPHTRAQITFPLLNRRHLVGILNVETPTKFSQQGFEFLKLIASRIASSLDNARLYALSQSQLLELRRLYDRIKSLEQLKTDMIRLAAHDIRNPVNTILGFIFLLDESPNLDADEKSYLESVTRAAQNIQQITEDILSLQRIEQMHDEGTYETLNLSDLIRRLYEKNQPQAAEKQQTYRLNMPEDAIFAWGDGAQLHEAIDNLIGNAIKYTSSEGTVTIELRQDSGLIIFEVTDTGYGIPEEQQARLFQPFYRAKTSETATIKGTGLGLHLVKNIIERHQGKMRFHSVYGQGSTFGFELPKLI